MYGPELLVLRWYHSMEGETYDFQAFRKSVYEAEAYHHAGH